MSSTLNMEIRLVDTTERVLVGVVAPYDEISYLVPDPGGERIIRGAFARSINARADRIPLHDNHGTDRRLGISRSFDDGDDGLVGTFTVFEGARGDGFLEEVGQGYFGGLSVGFQPLQATRGPDGVREVREAKLIEVSAVGMPAYESAGILATRGASLEDMLTPFRNPPAVNLDPIPPLWRT